MKNKTHIFFKCMMLLVLIFGLILSYPLTTSADSDISNHKNADHSINRLQQQIEINGTVTNAQTGDALPGVNIVIEGTTTGTTTDMDGSYSIEAPADASLRFSFVGYVDQTVEINGREEINVALQEQVTELEEVVAIGYGTQQKSQTTGSLSSVTSEQIDEIPVTDISEALKGNTSGIVALKSGNRPGAGTTIRVRGRRSLTASNDPLFVLDGIPYEGDISDINPRDIQSMEVLKGPSATAIYGSRGANGVVLVTTKRGGNYETEVTYSGKYGISEPIGLPDMMNAEEFAEFKTSSGASWQSAEREAYENGVSTDWLDLLLQNGFVNTHNLGIRGGDQKTQFALSADYYKKEGLIEKMDFERYTFRLNLDHNVSDNFQVGTSTQVTHRERNPHSVYYSALTMSPLADPYDEEGKLVDFPSGDPLDFNPLYDLQDNNYIDERQRLRLFSNIFANYAITQNFNYRMNLGLDLQHYRRGLFQASKTQARSNGTPYAHKNNERAYSTTFENIFTYSKNFSEIHSLEVTGLYSIESYREEDTDLSVDELPYEHQLFHNLGSAGTVQDYGSYLEEWGLMSFMGRANYQLMDRYLVTITGRYDGSSRLSEGKKWSFFPSAALGWRINNEPFMADQDLFSSLKLRVSYGRTGNTVIDPYQTKGSLARTAYNFGGNAGYGYRPDVLSNPDLQWEVSTSANIGVDFGLWDNRISGSFEVYQTYTTDLLLQRNLPITSGYGSVFQNIGETKNRGFEFNVTSTNIRGEREFGWSTTFNLSANREEIVALYGTGEDDVGNQWFIGEPLTVYYDYDKVGIWQLDEEEEAAEYNMNPGEIRIRDVNGDGTFNEEDKIVLGSDMPTLSGGMTNTFTYKNFDLSVSVFGSFGHMIYNNFHVSMADLQGRSNQLDMDYWTPDNPTNKHPKPNVNREYPLFGDTRGYMDGDFLKIRNIKLGYNLPETVLNTIGIQSMQIYVNSETPFIFSHLQSGLDPEVYGGYVSSNGSPTERIYFLGINMTF